MAECRSSSRWTCSVDPASEWSRRPVPDACGDAAGQRGNRESRPELRNRCTSRVLLISADVRRTREFVRDSAASVSRSPLDSPRSTDRPEAFEPRHPPFHKVRGPRAQTR
jgi:hypothetical protein